MHPQIEQAVRHIRRQTDELVAVVDGLDPDTFSCRPAEGRWAVAEHLAHLSRSIEPYVRAMEAVLGRARQKGWTRPPGESRELRGTWFGRAFIATFLLPLRPIVRFSVLQGGLICAAHTDRHIWLVRETLEGVEAGVP